MLGSLPTKLKVKDHEYKIETDYRNILVILQAYNDKDLTDRDKVFIILRRLYRDELPKIPQEDYEEALKAANDFIECRQHGENKKASPRIINWEKDEQILFPAINKAAGCEVRALPYLHWWTFLGYFQSVDSDSTWGYILALRQKRAKGKKLEKFEREFWNANREICMVDEPKTTKTGFNALDEMFDD
ncbi:MAG: Gp15 family bacteriophage protein [Bilifractor sp.]